MIVYLDTIISYIDEAGSNHEKAREFLERLEAELVASRLTLVELPSVYARAGFEDPQALPPTRSEERARSYARSASTEY